MGHSPSKLRSRSSESASSTPALSSAHSGEPCIVVNDSAAAVAGDDYTLNLPDECLACIFQFLSASDRNRSSLVCRRWLRIDGENRHRLSLNAQSHIADVVPGLFSRFVAVTKLGLKCDRRSVSIGDETLTLVSQNCRNLTRLKIRACRDLTDDGIAVFAANCKKLQKFSCGSSNFGVKGMNALLHHCAFLEHLSVKRLRGISDAATTEPIQPGKAAASLKMICLRDLYNGQCFEPLVSSATNLKSLKLIRCSGDWDKQLQNFAVSIKGLTEIHLERLQVSDLGLSAISNCSNLEVLHLVKVPECSNIGLINISEKCKFIRKLHIDGWRTNRISDDGLMAIATNCRNLQELILIGLNPTHLSLSKLSYCQNLERLALCGSETIGDYEISCIAAKCNALKKLCIKSCPVSNHGMEALAAGCPNLVKVKVKRCQGVTSEVADWLRSCRDSLLVILDVVIEPELLDVNANEQGNEEVNVSTTNTRRSTSLKLRLRSFSGRKLVAGTWRRWSSLGGRFFNGLGRRRRRRRRRRNED